MLGGLLFFFLLEKVELYRHAHHHEGDGHDHPHDFDRAQAGLGGFSVLVGDGIHNFCDGFIVAAAFMVDTGLGLITALAIVVHEIPHQIGDIIVLLNAGFTLRKALLFSAAAGSLATVGGLLGYFVIGQWHGLFPYLLVISGSSFVYVAVADLIPQMQRRMHWPEMLAQVAWIAAGLGLAMGTVSLLDEQADAPKPMQAPVNR
jgi:zinc and cadmium transporter